MDTVTPTSEYTVAQNTYYKAQVTDPTRKIEIEIGDSKQPDFRPQFKTLHWDNECNFSLRLADDSGETPTVDTSPDGSKVLWATSKREAHFYTQPGDEDGQFEFEIILKEQPLTNVITFTMQSKGLTFTKQGPLTDEIDGEFVVTATETEGYDAKGRLTTIRPENVVGSYAVSTSKRNHIQGDKNYRTGKAFHIYRPRLEDATGAWVWGELNIDEPNGLLTVTIPEKFLATAAYPIHHAAGLQIGYTSIGASTTATGANLFVSGRFASGGAGDANTGTLNIYCNAGTAFPAAVYANNAGTIDSQAKLSTVDASITPPGSLAWTSSSITWTGIAASTDYFIAMNSTGTGTNLRYDTSVAYSDMEYKAATNASMPATAPTALSALAREHSFYIDYTATATTIPNKIVQVKQAVNRASTY